MAKFHLEETLPQNCDAPTGPTRYLAVKYDAGRVGLALGNDDKNPTTIMLDDADVQQLIDALKAALAEKKQRHP